MTGFHPQLVEDEARFSSDLDSLIDELRDQVNTARFTLPKPEGLTSRAEQMENRLHEALVRFNETLSGNSSRKEQIELLRKEKAIFLSIQGKMMKELESLNATIASVVDRSNSAYAARDLAHSQMAQLKAQADKEHAEFEKEWNELARLIENDQKMREFIHQKEMNKRALEASRYRRVSKEQVMRVTEQDSSEQEMRYRLAELQNMFETIRQSTGISSMDHLLQHLVEREKANYSLFNKSNLNISELDLFRAQVESFKKDIATLTGGPTSSPGVEVSSDPSYGPVLESSVISVERKCDELGSRVILVSKLISSARSVVQTIFERLFSCASRRVEDYLSPSVIAGCNKVRIGLVTEANLLDYLAAVETRAAEVIAAYISYNPETDAKKITKDATRGKRTSMISTGSMKTSAYSGISYVLNQISQFRLPSALETDNADDDDDLRRANGDGGDHLRPLTRKELRARTLESIQRSQERNRLRRSNSKIR